MPSDGDVGDGGEVAGGEGTGVVEVGAGAGCVASALEGVSSSPWVRGGASSSLGVSCVPVDGVGGVAGVSAVTFPSFPVFVCDCGGVFFLILSMASLASSVHSGSLNFSKAHVSHVYFLFVRARHRRMYKGSALHV